MHCCFDNKKCGFWINIFPKRYNAQTCLDTNINRGRACFFEQARLHPYLVAARREKAMDMEYAMLVSKGIFVET